MRQLKISSVCIVLSLAALVSCKPAGESDPAAADAAARTAINAANAKGVAAQNARDRATFLSIYGEPVTVMSVSGRDIVGRTALDSSLGPNWASQDSGVVAYWHADSIEVHGDYGYEVGHGVFVRAGKGATAPDTARSRYITFWRKDTDGAWRAHRDFTIMLPKPAR